MAEGIARRGFDADLRDGQAAEYAFVHLFLQARVEVKSDEIACRTQRVFVEYSQQLRETGCWEPSGVAVTEAHSWAFQVNPGVWVLVPVDRLRAVFLRLWRERPDLRRRGGDQNRFKGLTIPIDDLLWLDVSIAELLDAARGGQVVG